ncbi:serine hydrolase domain-containing protein [Streptomyces turgidiscabies]
MALLTVRALVPTVGGAVAAPPTVKPDATALQAALDQVTATRANGAVAEVRQGGAVWRGSSGESRLNGRQPAPVDGRFRAGSITTTFTATVVLQLVGEGRLRLSDTAERWLPGRLPAPGGDKVTVREPLHHASRLPGYTDGLLDGDAPTTASAPGHLPSWSDGSPRTGTGTASAVPSGHRSPLLRYGPHRARDDRRQGHQPFVPHRNRPAHHSGPLGLRNTRLPGSSPFNAGPHSHGYEPMSRGDGPLLPVDYTTVNMSVGGAAGEIISTTADLDHFFRALLSGGLLRPAELRETTADTSGDGWGLGLETAALPCGTIVGHGGGTPGYRTISFHTPDGSRQATVDWTDWGTDADAGPAALSLMTVALYPL